MIRGVYKYILYPFAFLLLQLLRPFLNHKTKEMIRDKSGAFFKVNVGDIASIAAQRPFWIHAASGEIEYARPVIRELKSSFPSVPVIVTYSSPSAKKILSGLEIDAWEAMPWDFHSSCEAFLELWQPRAFLIARTDVWPVMAETVRRRGIPSLLFAATFAENSSRLRGVSGLVTAWALNSLSAIQCVSDDDALQLKRIDVKTPVSVCGDTRFDQVYFRLEHPKKVKSSLRPSAEARVFVAGSTWPEDEAVLIPAFAAARKVLERGAAKLLLVPHEIHAGHMKSLEDSLTAQGLTYIRYSTADAWTNEDVLLVDEVGILAELYTWGTYAFVGGSFRKQVHSVMEPLAAGLPVLVGPLHRNNREALQFKNHELGGIPIVQSVETTKAFTEALERLFPTDTAPYKAALKAELTQHRSSSQKVLAWIRTLS